MPSVSSDVPGRQFYRKGNDYRIADLEKIKRNNKFFRKYVVWKAISEDSTSSVPYFTVGNVNSKVYLQQLIEKV